MPKVTEQPQDSEPLLQLPYLLPSPNSGASFPHEPGCPPCTHTYTPQTSPLPPLPAKVLSWGLYLRSPILARCNLLTQEILLRGLGVMKTTMKLMGRPDLRGEGREG